MNHLLFLGLSAGIFILLLLANRFVRDFSPEQRLIRGKAYHYAALAMTSLLFGFAVFDDLLSYRETLLTIGFIGVAVVKNYCRCLLSC